MSRLGHLVADVAFDVAVAMWLPSPELIQGAIACAELTRQYSSGRSTHVEDRSASVITQTRGESDMSPTR